MRDVLRQVGWGITDLAGVHPPGARDYLGVPGLAAAHASLPCLRDAEWRHCMPPHLHSTRIAKTEALCGHPLHEASRQEAMHAASCHSSA